MLEAPPRERRRRSLDPSTATAFVGLVAILFFFGGAVLHFRFGEPGLLAAEWLLLFLPALVVVVSTGSDARRTLSLRLPTRLGFLGSLFLIVGAVPLVWVIGWLQTFVLPIPWELVEGLEELVSADSMGRLLWLLLLLAATPAICEEMVFRGVLLGGTRTLKPWKMLTLNGLVFGAFHLSLESVVRFLPTAILGIVIAWAVWRTGSIWVGVLMHFLNNTTIILLASAPRVREAFPDSGSPPPFWLVALAMTAFLLGTRLLARHTIIYEEDT